MTTGGPDPSPVGMQSGELQFLVSVPKEGDYALTVEYATAMEIGTGSWIQVAVEKNENSSIFYDDFLLASKENTTTKLGL